jgi:tetratricopeptide (TPR) repeat protein
MFIRSSLLGVLLLAACPAHGPLNPKTALHQQRGAALLAGDRLDEAEAEYLLALEYNPKNPEALNGLGLIAFRRGDLRRAAKLLHDAIAHNDELAEAHNNLGVALLGLGDLREAARSFRAALSIDPGYLNARYNLVLALRQLGERDKARIEWQKLLALAPPLAEQVGR